MDVLIVRGPTFYSQGDETAFFGWLKRIRAVQSVQGRGLDVHIGLRAGRVSPDELGELRAIFHRYALDTTPLEELRRRG